MLFEHKGYIVRQQDNRVVIWKDGSVVYRAKALKPLSRKQMVAMVEWQDLTKRRNTDDQPRILGCGQHSR